MPTTLYIDADACPVKDETVRVAERHGLTIHFVSNAFMRLPEGPLFKRVIVSDGPDAADNWIAEHAAKGEIVITAGDDGHGFPISTFPHTLAAAGGGCGKGGRLDNGVP